MLGNMNVDKEKSHMAVSKSYERWISDGHSYYVEIFPENGSSSVKRVPSKIEMMSFHII
jgi:hypothetical protein